MYHFVADKPAKALEIDGRTVVPAHNHQYLKSFQSEAVRFLYAHIVKHEFCVLNDESGLGKVISVALLLAYVMKVKKKCLIIVHNDEALTSWKFHLNIFTKLSYTVIKDTKDSTDMPYAVFIAKWSTLRTIGELSKFNFDVVVIDNRANMLSNNFCSSLLLRLFEKKVDILISSVDITSNIKLMHDVLRLGGRLEHPFKSFKAFESKFKLPDSRELTLGRAFLEEYFIKREMLKDYCKAFRLRRYRYQFDDSLPLVSTETYKRNLELWNDVNSSRNEIQTHLQIDNNVSSPPLEKDTQEVFQRFCNMHPERALNGNTTRIIDVQILQDNFFDHSNCSDEPMIMSPLFVISDSEDSLPSTSAAVHGSDAANDLNLTNDHPDVRSERVIDATNGLLKDLHKTDKENPVPELTTSATKDFVSETVSQAINDSGKKSLGVVTNDSSSKANCKGITNGPQASNILELEKDSETKLQHNQKRNLPDTASIEGKQSSTPDTRKTERATKPVDCFNKPNDRSKEITVQTAIKRKSEPIQNSPKRLRSAHVILKNTKSPLTKEAAKAHNDEACEGRSKEMNISTDKILDSNKKDKIAKNTENKTLNDANKPPNGQEKKISSNQIRRETDKTVPKVVPVEKKVESPKPSVNKSKNHISKQVVSKSTIDRCRRSLASPPSTSRTTRSWQRLTRSAGAPKNKYMVHEYNLDDLTNKKKKNKYVRGNENNKKRNTATRVGENVPNQTVKKKLDTTPLTPRMGKSLQRTHSQMSVISLSDCEEIQYGQKVLSRSTNSSNSGSKQEHAYHKTNVFAIPPPALLFSTQMLPSTPFMDESEVILLTDAPQSEEVIVLSSSHDDISDASHFSPKSSRKKIVTNPRQLVGNYSSIKSSQAFDHLNITTNGGPVPQGSKSVMNRSKSPDLFSNCSDSGITCSQIPFGGFKIFGSEVKQMQQQTAALRIAKPRRRSCLQTLDVHEECMKRATQQKVKTPPTTPRQVRNSILPTLPSQAMVSIAAGPVEELSLAKSGNDTCKKLQSCMNGDEILAVNNNATFGSITRVTSNGDTSPVQQTKTTPTKLHNKITNYLIGQAPEQASTNNTPSKKNSAATIISTTISARKSPKPKPTQVTKLTKWFHKNAVEGDEESNNLKVINTRGASVKRRCLELSFKN